MLSNELKQTIKNQITTYIDDDNIFSERISFCWRATEKNITNEEVKGYCDGITDPSNINDFGTLIKDYRREGFAKIQCFPKNKEGEKLKGDALIHNLIIPKMKVFPGEQYDKLMQDIGVNDLSPYDVNMLNFHESSTLAFSHLRDCGEAFSKKITNIHIKFMEYIKNNGYEDTLFHIYYKRYAREFISSPYLADGSGKSLDEIWQKTKVSPTEGFESGTTNNLLLAKHSIIAVEKTQYKDSGNIAINVYVATLIRTFEICDQNRLMNQGGVGVFDKSKESYGIRYNKKNGKLYFIRNRKIIKNINNIRRAVMYLNQANNLLKKHGDIMRAWANEISPTLFPIYPPTVYLFNNPSVQSLPVGDHIKYSLYSGCFKGLTSMDSEHLNANGLAGAKERERVRSRIYRVSKKEVSQGHKEKLLLDSLLQGVDFQKGIRKMLLNMPLQSKENLMALKYYIEMFGVGRVYDDLQQYFFDLDFYEPWVLHNFDKADMDFDRGYRISTPSGVIKATNRSGKFYIEYSLIPILAVYRLMEQGVSAIKAKNCTQVIFDDRYGWNNWLTELEDTLNALRYLRVHNIDFDLRRSQNFKELHDNATKAKAIHYQSKRKALLDKPWKSLFEPYHEDGYTLRPINKVAELMTVGFKMNHCVGSYMDIQLEGKAELFLLTNEKGKYLVCIEMIPNKQIIVQAKVTNNVPAHHNPELVKIIKNWAKLHNLGISTSDL